MSQYINFDEDDVVIGAGAWVNKMSGGLISLWQRPYRSLIARMMVNVWVCTPDVDKIQRVVACGNFVRPPQYTRSSRAAALKLAPVKRCLALVEATANITSLPR